MSVVPTYAPALELRHDPEVTLYPNLPEGNLKALRLSRRNILGLVQDFIGEDMNEIYVLTETERLPEVGFGILEAATS